MNKWLKGALVAVIFAGAFLVDRWNSFNSPADQLVKRIWVEQITDDLSAIYKMWICDDSILRHLLAKDYCDNNRRAK